VSSDDPFARQIPRASAHCRSEVSPPSLYDSSFLRIMSSAELTAHSSGILGRRSDFSPGTPGQLHDTVFVVLDWEEIELPAGSEMNQVSSAAMREGVADEVWIPWTELATDPPMAYRIPKRSNTSRMRLSWHGYCPARQDASRRL
jgi:hypothetical protein